MLTQASYYKKYIYLYIYRYRSKSIHGSKLKFPLLRTKYHTLLKSKTKGKIINKK